MAFQASGKREMFGHFFLQRLDIKATKVLKVPFQGQFQALGLLKALDKWSQTQIASRTR